MLTQLRSAVGPCAFALLLLACNGSSDAPLPGDPCAAIDHCPLSVNALLWCRNEDAGRSCPDTLRAWADCESAHCEDDAGPDPDGGYVNPCEDAGRAHQACLHPQR